MYILPTHELLHRIVALFQLLLPLSFFVCLSACISQQTAPGEEEIFNEEEMTFIEIGKSTREDIAAAVSKLVMQNSASQVPTKSTPVKFKDGDWWVYAQTRKRAEGWTFIFSPVGMDYSEYGGFDKRYLLIKFDNDGVVAEYELLSSPTDFGCNRAGICAYGPYLSFKAPQEDDRLAKQFKIPADRCSVYVYGNKTRAILGILLDGYRIGGLGTSYFYFKQLEPGHHQLGASGPNEMEPIPFDFTCIAGSLVFIELKTEGLSLFEVAYASDLSYDIEIARRDAAEGRRAIDERKLILGSEPSD